MTKPMMLAMAAAFLLPQTVVSQRVHEEPWNVSDFLFAPELVMRYQRQLELTDQQRTAIRDEVQQLQAAVLPLQWQLEYQNQALAEFLASDTVDQEAALQQLDQVIELEHQIKRHHFRYLIEIKNNLTADQQRRLRELRESHRPMPAMGEHMEGGMVGELREREMREHTMGGGMMGEMMERAMREHMHRGMMEEARERELREQGMRRRPEPANRL